MAKGKSSARPPHAAGLQAKKGFLEQNALYNVVRYQVVPPLFLIFFTTAVQVLVLLGRGETPCPLDFDQCRRITGNSFAWKFVGFSCLWAMASLWVPSKKYLGPATPEGHRPTYVDNGFLYFLVTTGSYIVAQLLYPSLSAQVYENMPEILGCFNNVALVLCAWLLLDGRRHQKSNNKKNPLLYDFYRGCELHPRLFGCDVKQLTNCRIGLMLWQVLVVAYLVVRLQRGGGEAGAWTTAALQTVYLAKFFWWETGYFNTLDITYDRAGYYLCWGCLVWVPALYTYHSFHQVAFPSQMSPSVALATFLLGVGCVLVNYRIDYEKQIFAEWWNSPGRDKKPVVRLWGREARWVRADYTDAQGRAKQSALLVTGAWGVARHGNYTFELLCTFCWSVPAACGYASLPALVYPLFLAGLLVHRCYRDEDKCQGKYGPAWKEYCKKVPYRMIPYIY